MNNQKKKNYLTRKDLIEETGAKHYTIAYMTLTGLLPLVRRADGPGESHWYHNDAIQIVKDYLNRKKVVDDEE